METQTNPTTEQATEAVVLSTDQVIENAVKSFSETEATDAKIAEMKAAADTLVIAGVEDKAGYKKVDAARKRVKDIRLKVTKKEAELLEIPKKFTADVKAESKRLIGLLKPIEDDLQLKQKVIDDVAAEIKKKKDAEIAAAKLKTETREKSLYALGALRDGEGRFVVEGFYVTPVQIDTESDETFDLLIAGIEQRKADREAAEAPKPEPIPVAVPAAVSEPIPTKAAPIQGKPEFDQGFIPTPKLMAASSATSNRVSRPATQPSVSLQFEAGFEACRRAVIAILENPEKVTRAVLIEKINALKAK